MNKKNNSKFTWLSSILAIALFMQLLVPFTIFLGGEKVNAASASIIYHGKVSYGGSTVGDFTIDGVQTFCIEHYRPTPPTGTPNDGGSISKNKKIAAALYWGWGGDKNIFGNDRDRGLVVTSLILSRIYTGEDAGGKSIAGYSTLWEKVQTEDVPDSGVAFSKPIINSSISGNVQKTETNKFVADSSNQVSFTLPSGVSLYNTTTGKNTTGGKVTLKGGESFYLTAPLTYGQNFSTGNLKGNMKDFAPIIYKMVNPSLQTVSKGVWIDPTQTTKFTANFEVRQKQIKVDHKDKFNNELLKTQKSNKNIGTKYSYFPDSSITKGNNTYVPINKTAQTGTLGNKDITLTFFYNLQRTITVKHVDARDNKELKAESYIKSRGEKYSYSPRNDLKKGNYTYRPVSSALQTGTVGSSDITLTFYYDVPLIKTGLEKIQIYTALATEGLPVKINLSKENIYPDSVSDMAKEKIKLNLYQGSTLVASKEYTAKNLPKSLDMEIPAKYLTANTNKPYTLKFEDYNKDAIDIPNDLISLITDGYTSSEKTIEVNSANTSILNYQGIVMTEREVKKDMKVFYESIDVPVEKIKKMRTGYGFFMPLDVTYVNEIGTGSTDFSFSMKVPKDIVDTKYIKYQMNGDVATVPLEQTKNNTITASNQKTSMQKFELQHVNIERITGALFSDTQVQAKDTRIEHEIIDGERKFYVPIWGYIGDYPITVESSKKMGINKVNFKINHNLNVFAHMLAHMDSPTIEQDALLFVPINADDPVFPEDWSEEDKKEYFEWNAEIKKEHSKGTTIKSKIKAATEFIFR